MEEDRLKIIMSQEDLDSLETGDVVGATYYNISDYLGLLTVKGQDNGNLRVLEGIRFRGRLSSIVEWVVPKKEISINRDGSISFYVTQCDHGVHNKTDRGYSELKALMQESGAI